MSKPYTLEELLVIAVAKEIHDFDKCILGIGLPTTAGAMAKALHAPNAILMMESGICDFTPLLPLNHIADAHACKGYPYGTDLFSMFTMAYRGFVDVCFLGVGQIDRFGNLNTTEIGDYYKPAMRLHGSGGAADFMSYSKRTVLTMRRGDLVEKLDYMTTPGYLTGGDSRDKTGYFPKGSGPSMVLSTQGVFRFDPETKEIYLAQIHPKVDVKDIKKGIPWDLKIAPNLTETETPKDEEIDFVRRFAPGISMGRELSMELLIQSMMKKVQMKAQQG